MCCGSYFVIQMSICRLINVQTQKAGLGWPYIKDRRIFFLGVPFNIASYVMMNQIIANELDFQPRRFIHTFGDAHFYCGKNERGQWYGDNFEEFQMRMRDAMFVEQITGDKSKYMNILIIGGTGFIGQHLIS